MLKVPRLLLIFFIYFMPSSLLGMGDPFDITLSFLGWRHDSLNTEVERLSSSKKKTQTQRIKALDIDVWSFGFKGRTTLSGLLFYEEGFWREHFYLKGSAYRGWMKHGTFKDQQPGNRVHSKEKIHSSIHSGRTLDADIGVGFSIPLSWWLSLGPVGGYSFNKQKILLNDHSHSSGESSFEKLKYTVKWKGPFAGVDLIMDVFCFRVQGGYEYHFGTWSGLWDLSLRKSSHSSSSSSSRQHSPRARGQIGYVDIRFEYTEGFDVGLGIRYQSWKTHKGEVSRKNDSKEEGKLSKATWQSYGVTCDIVYRF